MNRNQVDPSGCYDTLVTVSSFRPHYHLAGGVNLPKIIDCVGSDGKSRRQLVKVGVLLPSSGSLLPERSSHVLLWSPPPPHL